MDIAIGQSLTIKRTVTDADTASALGSGDVPVLATPRLLAWLEAATAQLCGSDEEHTSVGTRVDLDHYRASKVGTEVTCTAELVEVDGRNVVFAVTATQQVDGQHLVAGAGHITRSVVDRERFLRRL